MLADETIANKIYLIKGMKVILDRDPAEMYGKQVLTFSVRRTWCFNETRCR
jgi:hypothetical protein